MAEFKEVMRQYKRMCRATNCNDCPFTTELGWDCEPDILVEEEDFDIWETTVMEWARKHPEPIYPTIRELINYIMAKIPGESVSYETRIPANIAKEFNLVPINEGGFTKYERGEWAP